MDTALFGERYIYGGMAPFGIRQADRRQHLFVIGKSGSGKTALLSNLAIQDLDAGRGLAFIDPHGDAAEELLNHVPRRRTDDLIYFNPADFGRPIGFNLLERAPKDERHLIAASVVSTFAHLWADSWGPRSEYLLYNAVAALLDAADYMGGVSLLGVPRLFVDREYRQGIVGRIQDAKVRSFWTEEFEGYGDRLAAEVVAPIQNKAGALLSSPVLRNILGQPTSSFGPRAVMDEGKILIANLAKGKIGEAATNLLGSLLVTAFQLAAMRRADTAEAERRDFQLVIDEFASFSNESFPAILSEARKYRLSLTMACQFLSQVRESTRAAVLGNVGTIVCFRIGADDADLLARELTPYSAETLRDLGRGDVCVRQLESGEIGQPFLGRTFPPFVAERSRRENLVRQSRQRYGRDREGVERRTARWLKKNS